jgi:hypothetical protein
VVVCFGGVDFIAWRSRPRPMWRGHFLSEGISTLPSPSPIGLVLDRLSLRLRAVVRHAPCS